MEDRFKFRVWDKERKSFNVEDDKYAYYWLNEGGGLLEEYHDTVHCECDRLDKERYIIQQCTGLRIKDKLLYEKNIIKIGNEYIRVVEFCISLGRFVTYCEEEYKQRIDTIYKGDFQRFLECENRGFIDGYINDGIELEIIGNIYEQPQSTQPEIGC